MQEPAHHPRRGSTGFRKLKVPIRRPGKTESLFWWLAGIALAVLFLACVLIGYWTRNAPPPVR